MALLLTVENLDGQTITIEVAPTDHFGTVRARIQTQTGIPPERQRLLYRGTMLPGAERTVADYDIQDGHVIKIVHHGCLQLPT